MDPTHAHYNPDKPVFDNLDRAHAWAVRVSKREQDRRYVLTVRGVARVILCPPNEIAPWAVLVATYENGERLPNTGACPTCGSNVWREDPEGGNFVFCESCGEREGHF